MEGRRVSEIFRAVSGGERLREGKFQTCFGQFPGKEDRGEESSRNASEQFHKLFGQFPGREKRGEEKCPNYFGQFPGRLDEREEGFRNVSGSFLGERIDGRGEKGFRALGL